jgi:hypothetical protein
MSDTKVDGNILNVSSRAGQNPGMYKVFADNNPQFEGEGAARVGAEEFLYECFFNGTLDISFAGTEGEEKHGHHWHLPGPGIDRLAHSGGYTTNLKFNTSDGVHTASLRVTVKGVVTERVFNVQFDFPVPPEA